MNGFHATAAGTLELAGGLELQVPAGNILVEATDDTAISIRATKRVRAVDEQCAIAFMNQMELNRRLDGDWWRLEAAWPEPHQNRTNSAHMDLEIRLPREVNVHVETGAGEVVARGVNSPRIRTAGGNVRLEECTGEVDAQTSGGVVAIASCSGSISAETSGGNIEVRDGEGTLAVSTGGGGIAIRNFSGPSAGSTGGGAMEAFNVHGPLRLHTGGGSVRLDDCPGPVDVQTGGGSIDIRRAGGAIKVGTGGGSIEIEVNNAAGPVAIDARTGSGGINLILPIGSSARVHASTSNGRVSIPGVPGTNGEESDVNATIGAGEGRITLESGSGDIRVRFEGT